MDSGGQGSGSQDQFEKTEQLVDAQYPVPTTLKPDFFTGEHFNFVLITRSYNKKGL